MNAISLSLPLINLHLTSLPKAISDSFVSTLPSSVKQANLLKSVIKTISSEAFFLFFADVYYKNKIIYHYI